MSDEQRVALYEVDGGMWKNDAIESIKAFLKVNLEEFTQVHILA